MKQLYKLMQNSTDLFSKLNYLKGFGNTFISEALEGAVPQNQNSPIKLKYGLYPEQLSGTAFTVKRGDNQKIWLYKLRPSAVQGKYKKSQSSFKIVGNFNDKQNIEFHPNQLRWKAIPSVEGNVNFVQGLVSVMGAGDPSVKQGLSIYIYSANTSMDKKAFYNSDGDFLIVPFKGTLNVKTQTGLLTVKPRQILVIPRGIKFSIDCTEQIKGWVAQSFGYHFSLPELGPIGANGLAVPQHFEYPTAWFQDKKEDWIIYNKFIGEVFQGHNCYSPFDVVGWKGNYSAFKYDLDKYNTIGSISYDHPDPSIFTVLTCKSSMEGTASLDFVIFPPRWLVQEHTFKPPYYHRNCMSQFMGNICGQYDAKGEGFGPGCSSLHSAMTPHGPDADAYEGFVKSTQKPYKIPDTNLAFMFQSCYLLKTTKYAFTYLTQDTEYYKCWERLANIKYEAQ